MRNFIRHHLFGMLLFMSCLFVLNLTAYAEETEPETEAFTTYTTEFTPISYIMVGDSRFVGMHEAVGDADCTWICEVATELSWFTNTAVPQIDEAATSGSAIVINMGVNDLGNAMGYVEVLKQKVPEWLEKGAVVYYMSVNPIQRHATISNNAIVEFNNTVYANMPEEMGWIETNAYLLENGYGTIDGLHFDAGTNQTIFQYCMDYLES